MKLFSSLVIGAVLALSTSVNIALAADNPPVDFHPLTSFTNSLASAGNVTNLNPVANEIPSGKKILCIQGTFVAVDSGTSNVVAGITTTLDSTATWPNSYVGSATWTLNGTNPVTAIALVTNPPGRFFGIGKWSTTQTNGVSWSNLKYSFIEN